jgi:hypothetical protein
VSEVLVAEENSAAAAEPAACPECGEPIAGRFCTRCGEKRFEVSDYSLRHFLAEALNVFAGAYTLQIYRLILFFTACFSV